MEIKRAFIEIDSFVLPLTKMEFKLILGKDYSKFFATEITNAISRKNEITKILKTYDEVWFDSPLIGDSNFLFMEFAKTVLADRKIRGIKIFNLNTRSTHKTNESRKRIIATLEKRGFEFFFGEKVYTQYPVKNLEDLAF